MLPDPCTRENEGRRNGKRVRHDQSPTPSERHVQLLYVLRPTGILAAMGSPSCTFRRRGLLYLGIPLNISFVSPSSSFPNKKMSTKPFHRPGQLYVSPWRISSRCDRRLVRRELLGHDLYGRNVELSIQHCIRHVGHLRDDLYERTTRAVCTYISGRVRPQPSLTLNRARYAWTHAGVAFIGVGSFIFHATLSWHAQVRSSTTDHADLFPKSLTIPNP